MGEIISAIDRIEEQVKQLGLNPEDIELIVITHGHGDHFDSAQKIKESTGAKKLLGYKEMPILGKEGKKGFPTRVN